MDDAKIKKLAVLGYMAARADSPYSAPGEEGADPKDKIQIANTVLRINNLLQNFPPVSRCDKAIPELKKALVTSPNISLLHFFLGGCYLDKDDYASAVPELQKAVKLDPGFSHAEMNLGRALMQTGDFDSATIAFEHVAKTEPNMVDAHVYLIVLYTKAGHTQDVIKECQTVLHYMPENFGRTLISACFAEDGRSSGCNRTPPKGNRRRTPQACASPRVIRCISELRTRSGRDEREVRGRTFRSGRAATFARPPDAAPDSNRSTPQQ